MKDKRIIEFDASIDRLHDLLSSVADVAENRGMSKARTLQFELAIEEAFVNIINYSGHPLNNKIKISLIQQKQAFDVTLIDQGMAFNPLEYVPLAKQKDKEGGFGIILMKKSVDHLHYQRIGNENHLTLTKNY